MDRLLERLLDVRVLGHQRDRLAGDRRDAELDRPLGLGELDGHDLVEPHDPAVDVGQRAATPGYAEAHNNLATVLQRQGDLSRAEQHFERTLELQPGHAEAHNNLGVLYESRRDFAGAAEQYDAALRSRPDFAQAHSNLGNVLLIRGALTQARERYESALALQPDFAEAHNNLGFVQARLGDPQAAITHYRRALALRPDLFQAASGLAWILATHADPALRDGRQALRQAEHCARLTANRDVGCLEGLAAAHAELGAFDQAIQWQSRAMSLVPANAHAPLSARLESYRAGRPWRDSGN